MKKNDRFHIVIEDLGENGEGIGRADGYTLFVKGALIGDEIEGVCTKAQKSYGFGRLLRVVKPGPDRVEARCPVAGPCGGCQLQCMDYAAQLAFKERKVREHLVRIGGMSPEEADVVMEPIVGARIPGATGIRRRCRSRGRTGAPCTVFTRAARTASSSGTTA